MRIKRKLRKVEPGELRLRANFWMITTKVPTWRAVLPNSHKQRPIATVWNRLCNPERSRSWHRHNICMPIFRRALQIALGRLYVLWTCCTNGQRPTCADCGLSVYGRWSAGIVLIRGQIAQKRDVEDVGWSSWRIAAIHDSSVLLLCRQTRRWR